MKYVEVIADPMSVDTITAIAKKVNATDCRLGMIGEDGQQTIRLLVSANQLQRTLDLLSHILGAQPAAHIMVMPVETLLPKIETDQTDKPGTTTATREAIYQNVEKGARLDSNYLLLVVLSTIVAAIGLIENNVAVVIGAMVIAPLLGPNLALSLGTALGDVTLMRQSIKTLSVGIVIAIGMSILFGLWWPDTLDSHELLSRTDVNIAAMTLALASGAAATLSLTTGLSSVLVGVMVAVALLPPAVTIGIMLGTGQWSLALGASLLLAINIISVNLSSKLVFLFKGISPRTWYEQQSAKKAMTRYLLGWAFTLSALVLFIYLRKL